MIFRIKNVSKTQRCFYSLLLVVVLSLLLMRMYRVITINLFNNLAYLSLSAAFNERDASIRQLKLKEFIVWFQRAKEIDLTLPMAFDDDENAMTRSIYMGQQYRSEDNNVEAARWFYRAAMVDPYPEKQEEIFQLMPGRLSQGEIVIDDFSLSNNWRPHTSNNVGDIDIEFKEGVAIISYLNRTDQRDILAYTYDLNNEELPLLTHNQLKIRIKGEEGSFFTLETVIDGVRQRHLDYYSGNGQWEILHIQLYGRSLQAVLLSFGEPEGVFEDEDNRSVFLDWVHLEMD